MVQVTPSESRVETGSGLNSSTRKPDLDRLPRLLPDAGEVRLPKVTERAYVVAEDGYQSASVVLHEASLGV